MSSTADSSTLTKGTPLDLALAALLTALLCACGDVAFELWLQGTVADVPAHLLPPAGVSLVLVFGAVLGLGILLRVLPWPALGWREAAAVAAFDVGIAFLVTSWFASRSFGGGWMSTSVVVTVGMALGAAMLGTSLLFLEREIPRLARWLSPASLAPVLAVAVGAVALRAPLGGTRWLVLLTAFSLVMTALHWWRRPAMRSVLGLVVASVVPVLILVGTLRTASTVKYPERDAPDGPPLVLLLTVDTLRADYSGLGEADLPNLTRLAREGTVYENAMSSSGWTVPSFASMLTGLAPEAHQTGMARDTLSEAVPTLGEQLQAEGYRTIAIGKNPFLRPYRGLDRGFDCYDFYPRNVLETSVGSRLLRRNRTENPLADIDTDGLADAGIQVLETVAEQPTFLWLHFFDPHIPYAPPERFLGDAQIRDVIGGSFNRMRDQRGGYFVADEDERYAIEELYRGEIRWVDEAIGRVIAKLESLGLWDRTLIVFTSDHGEEFWEHGGFEHGHTLYNELLHVPLIVKPPGGAPGRVQQRVPTASVFASIRSELGLTGELPFAVAQPLPTADPEADADAGEELAFSTHTKYYENRSAVQFGSFKYIVWDSGFEELYDLSTDPGEQKPLDLEAPERESALARGRELIELQRESAGVIDAVLSGETEERELDAQTLRRLRSLGYVQ